MVRARRLLDGFAARELVEGQEVRGVEERGKDGSEGRAWRYLVVLKVKEAREGVGMGRVGSVKW